MSLYLSLNYQKRKSQYDSKDEIPVILFYYYNGNKIKISTGVTVRKGDWNPDLENPIKRSDSNYKFKNLQLKQKMVEVEKIIQNIELNGKIPETTLVKLYLKKILDEKVIDTKKEYDFFLLIKEYEVILKNDTRFTNGYRKHVVNCLIQISDYIREELNSSFYPISSLDEDFQKGYFNYSVTEKKRLNSTIQNHFKRLKSFVKWCYKSGYVTSPLETI
ncbi:MAG: Arm DNA-binding domain-containing protein, partial [Salibacteraceae bacterium]|nr:Arm DNA-binding domain-containing protein [Salibacteraceae bacterium]